MKVSVPWPHRDLHPNARVHHFTLARRRRAYRIGCGWEARAAGLSKIEVKALPVKITFHPPDKRRRDVDGLVASMKAAQDGIADVIGVDDHLWVPTYAMGEPVERGRVVFAFEVAG